MKWLQNELNENESYIFHSRAHKSIFLPWYQIWAVIVAVAAVYVLVKFFAVLFADSPVKPSTIDYILMVFVNFSIVFEMYLFPKSDKEQITGGLQ